MHCPSPSAPLDGPPATEHGLRPKGSNICLVYLRCAAAATKVWTQRPRLGCEATNLKSERAAPKHHAPARKEGNKSGEEGDAVHGTLEAAQALRCHEWPRDCGKRTEASEIGHKTSTPRHRSPCTRACAQIWLERGGGPRFDQPELRTKMGAQPLDSGTVPCIKPPTWCERRCRRSRLSAPDRVWISEIFGWNITCPPNQ